jgi:hypothetical protein
MKAICCLILLLTVSSFDGQVAACEMLTLPPTAPIRGLVLFEGRVEQPLPASRPIPGVIRLAPGILVLVTASESVIGLGATVEVLPLRVNPACEPTPWDAAEVAEWYPSGTRITVIGRTLEDHAQDPSANSQVVIWPSEFGGLGRIPDQVVRIPAGCLDFERFRATYETNPYPTWSREIAWRNAQRAWFEDFEFLSCLANIEMGVNPSELEGMLHSMAFYSRYDGVNVKLSQQLYGNLVKRTGLSRSARGRLREEFSVTHDAR